jgi:hypothetical protein
MSDGSVQMYSVLRFMQRHYFLRLQAASSLVATPGFQRE